MPIYVIWVDRENANLFHFSNQKMERKDIHATHQDHHTHQIDSLDHQNQEHAFHRKLVTHITDASRILILGPGVAKHHFQNFLTEQYPLLAKKVVGCEAVDHPTDPQIAAMARKFFNMVT